MTYTIKEIADLAGVTTRTIIDQVVKQGRTDVQYVSSMAAMVATAVQNAEPGDMVLILGAGDIYKVGDLLLDRLRDKFGEAKNDD